MASEFAAMYLVPFEVCERAVHVYITRILHKLGQVMIQLEKRPFANEEDQQQDHATFSHQNLRFYYYFLPKKRTCSFSMLLPWCNPGTNSVTCFEMPRFVLFGALYKPNVQWESIRRLVERQGFYIKKSRWLFFSLVEKRKTCKSTVSSNHEQSLFTGSSLSNMHKTKPYFSKLAAYLVIILKQQ